jgi:hypothetical protein
MCRRSAPCQAPAPRRGQIKAERGRTAVREGRREGTAGNAAARGTTIVRFCYVVSVPPLRCLLCVRRCALLCFALLCFALLCSALLCGQAKEKKSAGEEEKPRLPSPAASPSLARLWHTPHAPLPFPANMSKPRVFFGQRSRRHDGQRGGWHARSGAFPSDAQARTVV